MDIFGIFAACKRLAASLNALASTADEINAATRQHVGLSSVPALPGPVEDLPPLPRPEVVAAVNGKRKGSLR